MTHWISHYGLPLDMSSDWESQFTFQLWNSIAQLLGTTLHRTTVYHLQADGLVERFHHHFKSALRARLNTLQWKRELPWIRLGIRTAPKEDLGCSAAEMLYGAPLTAPGNFISSQSLHSEDLQVAFICQQVISQVTIPITQHGLKPSSFPHNLKTAKFVFILRDVYRTL